MIPPEIPEARQGRTTVGEYDILKRLDSSEMTAARRREKLQSISSHRVVKSFKDFVLASRRFGRPVLSAALSIRPTWVLPVIIGR